MKSISFVYNPYTRQKKLSVNGKDSDLSGCWENEDSKTDIAQWKDSFFQKLYDKYNDNEMQLTFTGIPRDAEYLEDALKEFKTSHPKINIELKSTICSTPADKLKELQGLFNKMQEESPFPELKDKALNGLFEKITSDDFEIAVIATMSSGKSTLINAMLGREILPARNEATTATLARIHDIDGKNDFSGKCFNESGEKVSEINHLTLTEMNKLNSDSKIASIEIYGDIEGISSKGIKLVLTDTPGPNNSRTASHKERTYKLIKDNEYKPMILYVLNGTQLETNDDCDLLNDMANAMASKGRQASERFIFVLNKADEFDPDKDEHIQDMIKKVKAYLERHGIHNPRIFPCASRMAKIIRQHLNGEKLSETEEDDLPEYNSFIKRSYKHFSDYAPLSQANQCQLKDMLDRAQKEKNGYKEALIYTGIPAIELAITEYLTKYALPTKLTEGVLSFKQRIDNIGIEAQTKNELKDNREKQNDMWRELQKIERDLNDGKKIKAAKANIDKISIPEALKKELEQASTVAMQQFTNITQSQSTKIPVEDAKTILKTLQNLEIRYKVDIEHVLNDCFKQQAEQYVNEFKKYLNQLIRENTSYPSPAAVLGDIATISGQSSLDAYTQTEYERVLSGWHWEKNSRRWFFEFWEPKRIKVTDYKTLTKTSVNFEEFKNELFDKYQSFIRDTRLSAEKAANNEIPKLKDFFKKELDKIEDNVKSKIHDKRKLLKDQYALEKELDKNINNLHWIDELKEQLGSLLKIG